MDNQNVDEDFVQHVLGFFINPLFMLESDPSILEQALAFERFIVPNKEFGRYEEIVRKADGLADALEQEISKLKESVALERDAQLAAARGAKKAIRGFVVHAYKERLVDEPSIQQG